MSDSFTFTHTVEDDEGDIRSQVNMSIYGNTLTHTEVATRFTEFLLGCGYIFDTRKLLRLTADHSD